MQGQAYKGGKEEQREGKGEKGGEEEGGGEGEGREMRWKYIKKGESPIQPNGRTTTTLIQSHPLPLQQNSQNQRAL
jgi:hypothetical protein